MILPAQPRSKHRVPTPAALLYALRLDPVVVSQPAQRLEVLDVQRVGDHLVRFVAVRRLLGLDQERQPAETRIAKQPSKRLEPQTAFPDVFMAIDAAPARALRVIAVKDPQPIEADQPIER